MPDGSAARESIPSPKRRWYESPPGARAASDIRQVIDRVVTSLVAGDVSEAMILLEQWEHAIDVEPLSRPALHSIRSALADAHWAIAKGRNEDARAFVQAVATMLPNQNG